jgi:peptidoglycan L-alanyl-D-glutamate endopeptidase CwlK
MPDRKQDSTALFILGALGLFLLSKPAINKGVEKVLNYENDSYLDNLHPDLKKRFQNLINEIEKLGFRVLITSGYRSFEKQAKLKEENASNAAAGFSLHNYGAAIDINLQKGFKLLTKKTDKRIWLDSGVPQLAKKLGFIWGGDLSGYYDPVHFAIKYDTKQLYARALKQYGNDPRKIQGNKVSLSGLTNFIL